MVLFSISLVGQIKNIYNNVEQINILELIRCLYILNKEYFKIAHYIYNKDKILYEMINNYELFQNEYLSKIEDYEKYNYFVYNYGLLPRNMAGICVIFQRLHWILFLNKELNEMLNNNYIIKGGGKYYPSTLLDKIYWEKVQFNGGVHYVSKSVKLKYDKPLFKDIAEYFKELNYVNKETGKITLFFEYPSEDEADEDCNIFDSILLKNINNSQINMDKLGYDIENMLNYGPIKKLLYGNWSNIVVSNLGFYYKPNKSVVLKEWEELGFDESDSRLLPVNKFIRLEKKERELNRYSYILNREYKNYKESRAIIRFDYDEDYKKVYDKILREPIDNSGETLLRRIKEKKVDLVEERGYGSMTKREVKQIIDITKIIVYPQIRESIEKIIWQYICVELWNFYKASLLSSDGLNLVYDIIKKEIKLEELLCEEGCKIIFLVNSVVYLNFCKIDKGLNNSYGDSIIRDLEKKLNELNIKIHHSLFKYTVLRMSLKNKTKKYNYTKGKVYLRETYVGIYKIWKFINKEQNKESILKFNLSDKILFNNKGIQINIESLHQIIFNNESIVKDVKDDLLRTDYYLKHWYKFKYKDNIIGLSPELQKLWDNDDENPYVLPREKYKLLKLKLPILKQTEIIVINQSILWNQVNIAKLFGDRYKDQYDIENNF